MRNLDAVPLKDWTFEDLIGHSVWTVISALTRGESLRSAMWHINTVAIGWHKETTQARVTPPQQGDSRHE